MNTTDLVRRLLVDNVPYDGSPADLEDDDFPLIDNHVIDSLELMKVTALIEERFGVQVDDDDIVPQNFSSIAAIARFIESKRAA